MFRKKRREDIIIEILDSLMKQKSKKKIITYLRLIKGGKK
jgi:hypothetical protein